jgi:hypothetical protein
MGKLKSFYHDEISSWESTSSPAPTVDTCFVITERDKLTGQTVPVQVFTFRADAEDALRLFAFGQKTFQIPEYLQYSMTEVKQT